MKCSSARLAVWLLVGAGSGLLAQPAPPSFKNLVAVGDSLTAGFQNGSLNLEGQANAYPTLVARQVGTYHFLALITKPGIPNELVLRSPGPPPVVEPVAGPRGTRSFPLIVPQNLAIPGQTTRDALTRRPDLPLDTLEDVILGVPSLLIPGFPLPPLSQIEMAFALRPTFTLLWLGSNEVLGAVLAADASRVFPFDAFQPLYSTAVGTVLASGSRLAVANIPDPTVIPLLVPAEGVAGLVGAPLAAIGPLLGIQAGDRVTLPGLALVPAILAGQTPGPLPAGVVLTEAETAAIRATVAAMNAFIDNLGKALEFPVVDIHGLLNQIHRDGFQVGNVTLTTAFLGGLFSLDGVHPTNTGQAIIANQFIQAINGFYGLQIPPVDVAKILAADPLVFKKTEGPPEPPFPWALVQPEVLSPMISLLARDEPPSDDTIASDLSQALQASPRVEVSQNLGIPEVWIANLPAYSLLPGPLDLSAYGYGRFQARPPEAPGRGRFD